MNEIKPKWKALAASYMLSAWNERTASPASQVFDLIVNCTEENLRKTFDDHDIIAWAPFSKESLVTLARLMWQLAADMQATDMQATEEID